MHRISSLTFGQIGPLTMELAALDHLKISHGLIMGKWCLQGSLFIFDRIFVKLADNQDSHKISDEFEFWLDRIRHFGVTYPSGQIKFSIDISWCLHLFSVVFDLILFILAGTRTCIKSWRSLTLGHIGPLTMELAALERLKISHRLIMGKWCLQLARSFFIRSSSNLLVTRTALKSQMSANQSLRS